MKTIYAILSLLLSAAFCFADTTFVQAGDVSGIWNRDGSPYLISYVRVNEGDALIIEPGVTVLLPGYGSIEVRGALYASGTAEDSIRFIRVDRETWISIYSSRANSIMEFDYCYFNGSGGDQAGAISAYMRFFVKHCTFENCTYGITFESTNGVIEECLFKRNFMAIKGGNWGVVISKCIFDRVGVPDNRRHRRFLGVWLSSNDTTMVVRNCLFIDSQLADWGNGLILQNIFLNDSTGWINSPWGQSPDIHYTRNNCFIGNNPQPFTHIQEPAHDTIPADLGVLSMVNLNGDSTDRYGNLYLDPRLIADDGVGGYRLDPYSPCIDAGDPNLPLDPDSTIADIGPFFFPQPNIAIDTLLIRFEPIPIGARAQAPFSIRNQGLEPLWVFIEEERLQPPFRLSAGGDTLHFRPGESQDFTIEFQPRAAGAFLDSVLIRSDDRHDSLIVLYVVAEATNGVSDLHLAPSTFHLSPAYPNPFNSSTTITFSLPLSSLSSSLRVYDLTGRLVADLTPKGRLAAGEHRVVWNAAGLASGVYLVRLEAGGSSFVRKTVLMR